MQLVTSRGVTLAVPADWPVYDLATQPDRCVRADEQAVYLGQQGANADCPAGAVGRTVSVQVQPLNERSQLDADRATRDATVNGVVVRVDPDPGTNRALLAVLPAQQTVVTITYRDDRAPADRILQTLTLA
jgi:hypothetical protein